MTESKGSKQLQAIQEEIKSVKAQLDRLETGQADRDKKSEKHEVSLAVIKEQVSTLVGSVACLNKHFEGNGIGSRLTRMETDHINLAGSFKRCQQYEKGRWKLLWKSLIAFGSGLLLLIIGYWLNEKFGGGSP